MFESIVETVLGALLSKVGGVGGAIIYLAMQLNKVQWRQIARTWKTMIAGMTEARYRCAEQLVAADNDGTITGQELVAALGILTLAYVVEPIRFLAEIVVPMLPTDRVASILGSLAKLVLPKTPRPNPYGTVTAGPPTSSNSSGRSR